MARNVFYGWWALNPHVLYESIVPYDPLQLHPWLPSAPILRLLTPVWRLEVHEAIAAYKQITSDRPMDEVCFLCAEQDLLHGLREAGIAAVMSSHNAFLDERIYAPLEVPEKRFDAVYNARMAPWKRHATACEVERLLIVGSAYVVGDDDEDYEAWLHMLMPNAHFLPQPDERALTAMQVAKVLCSARVGLCLSACEGAMYASVEYLLAGLPVVSTPSVGGRDQWFEDWFARIVDPDPVAVAQAVADFVQAPPSPQSIRETTIERARQQRATATEVVQRWFERRRSSRRFGEEFEQMFFNKMGAWRSREQVQQHMLSDSSGRPKPTPGPSQLYAQA